MVEYKIKGDITSDVYIKESAPDLMDGVQDTVEIIGGLQSRAEYLMQGTIPSKPTFGSGLFKGVDFSLYNASLTPGDRSSSLPELVAYKVKEGYSVTEGYAKLNSTHGSSLHQISACANGYESMVDYFDGSGSSYKGGDVSQELKSIGSTVIGSSDPYTTVYDLKSHGYYLLWGLNEAVRDTDQYDSYAKVRKNFGLTAAEIGLQGLPQQPTSVGAGIIGRAGTPDYVKLEKVDTESNDNASGGWYRAVKKDPEALIGLPHIAPKYVKFATSVQYNQETGDTGKTKVTEFNSIFDEVRGAETFMGDSETDGSFLIASGDATLSSESALSRGSALELSTFINHANKDEVVYPSRVDDGPINRQEVVLVKKYLPYPLNLPISPNTDVDAASVNYDVSEHGSTIQLDINIKQLATAMAFSDDAAGGLDFESASQDSSTLDVSNDEQLYTLRRSFTIMFSTVAPTQQQTLYDYVWSNYTAGHAPTVTLGTSNGNAGKNRIGKFVFGSNSATADDANGSMFSLRDNNDKTPMAGITFIKTAKGIAIIPMNGAHGEAATEIANCQHSWYITPKGTTELNQTEDIVIRQNAMGHTNKQDGLAIEDKWVRLNFVFTPQNSRATGYNSSSTRGHLTSARGHYSFCRMYMSNPETGELYLNQHATSLASSNVYQWDLGIIGDHGGFLGYYGGAGYVKASVETVSMATTDGTTPGVVNIDGTAVTITTNRTAAQVAALIVAADYPNYTAAVTNTDRVTFTQRDGGTSGNITLVGSDLIYVKTGGGSHTISKQGGGAFDFTGGIDGTLGSGVSQGTSDSDHDSMSNWLSNMSIWLTNIKEVQSSANSRDMIIPDADYSPTSKVIIDKFSLKDFNYDHTNASFSLGDRPRDRLNIGAGSTFQSIEATTQLTTSFVNNIDSRKTDSPSILCFGFNPSSDSDQPLGKGQTSGATKNFGDYEWPIAFYMNDFQSNNINNLGPIADRGIRGGASAMYHNSADSSTSLISLGDSFGDYNIDDTSTNPSHTIPNRQNDPSRSCSLSGMKSTLSVASVNTGAKTVTFAAASAWIATTEPNPIKVGQQVRFNDGATIDGSTLTVSGLSGNANSGLTITTLETPSGDIDTDSDAFVLEQGMCNNFSRKGGFITFQNSGSGTHPIKKEHIASSARVLGIVKRTSTHIELNLDTVKPLLSSKDEKYIVYLYNHHVDGSNTSTDATHGNRHWHDLNSVGYSDVAKGARWEKHDLIAENIDEENKTITFAWDGYSTNTTNTVELITEANIPFLLVSPYRIWAYFLINTIDEAGDRVSPRSYGSCNIVDNNWTDTDGLLRVWNGTKSELVSATTSGGISTGTLASREGFGTTYNEFLYNDTTIADISGAYSNSWDLGIIADSEVLDLNTNLGYGAYDETLSETTGFIAKTLIKSDQYNDFKCRNPDSTENVIGQPGDNLSLYLRYRDRTRKHRGVFNTRHNDNNKPKIYSVFEDIIPITPKLTVAPYESDPFFPEFKWDTADSDLWYGILQISPEQQILSQYDGIVAHIPLNEEISGNEDSTTHTSIFLENESGTKTAATAGQFIQRHDGIAGFSKEFDGTDDYLTFADFTPPSDEMSIVAHITPNSGSGIRQILTKWNNGGDAYNDYELEITSSHKVNFSCLANGSTTMTSILGPVITTDGKTPTVIIATVDTNVRQGNLKLYYDGKLVAESGAAAASATGSVWEGGGTISGVDADVEDDSGILYVGATANAAGTRSSFFNGKIEEIAIYNRVIYPVVPSQGSYVFTRPMYEVDSNFESPTEYSARLFIKDYHNIRGRTTDEVAASSQISYHKAAFRMDT